MCSTNGKVGASLILLIIKGLFRSWVLSHHVLHLFSHIFCRIRFWMCSQVGGYESLLAVKWRQEFGARGRAVVELEMLSKGIAGAGPDGPRSWAMGRAGERPLRGHKGYYFSHSPDTTRFSSKDYWERVGPDILGAKVPWPAKNQIYIAMFIKLRWYLPASFMHQ